MKPNHSEYDAIVIGSGPSGQNAAIKAANLGARVLLIEREVKVGGACVQYGTIPSKTLRETAVTLSSFKRRSGDVYDISRREDLQITSLLNRLHQVVEANQSTTQSYLDFAGVEKIHGQAKFVSATEVSIRDNFGKSVIVTGERIFIAAGSRPRNPPEIPVDHEHILDSDSILSMSYLPQSLTVFGGGVIASEYASTFACLGVRVVMIDRYPTPMGFLDPDLIEIFVREFESNGGEFRGNRKVQSVSWDGISKVVTTLDNGDVIESDKALVAQGRIANTDSLGIDAAGITLTDRGFVTVDEHYQTEIPSVYAVGDAIGPPSLASSSMEQGRSAAGHAFGESQQAIHTTTSLATPMGIYTIPEMSSVGITEQQARKEHGDIIVGQVNLVDLARGQIMATKSGMLKLVSDREGKKLLGVHIVGDGATELIHLGQMAMKCTSVDELAGAIFNFPTLAEAYRMAAQNVIRQRKPIKSGLAEEASELTMTPTL